MKRTKDMALSTSLFMEGGHLEATSRTRAQQEWTVGDPACLPWRCCSSLSTYPVSVPGCLGLQPLFASPSPTNRSGGDCNEMVTLTQTKNTRPELLSAWQPPPLPPPREMRPVFAS